MDTQNEEHSRSTFLYDAGCGSVMVMFFGVVFLGVVANYSWDHSISSLISSLYDVGGRFLIAMFFGVVFFGVVIDYLWNYLILSLGLRWQKINIMKKRIFVYTAIITAIGFLIDWLYYEFTWGAPVIASSRIPAIFETPGLNPGLELSTILIPMALIGALNYFASRFHLHLDKKHASVVGLVMAVFTAPWLVVAFVLLS
jgi:hypothetical protein